MQVSFENNNAILTGLTEFDPQHIFENGQAFRFTPSQNGGYEGVAFGRFLHVWRECDRVFLYPATKREFMDIWYDYFDLGRDYASLFLSCTDPALRDGQTHAPGLRVLRQQPFETLISFIISANNNLARIRGIIKKLCQTYGKPFTHNSKTYHAFPTPRALAAATGPALKQSAAATAQIMCGARHNWWRTGLIWKICMP